MCVVLQMVQDEFERCHGDVDELVECAATLIADCDTLVSQHVQRTTSHIKHRSAYIP